MKNHKLSIYCIIIIFSIFNINAISFAGVPTGFYPIKSAHGVSLYKKDYTGGQPDFVQIVNLSQGAKIKLSHEGMVEAGLEEGPYGGNNPTFDRQSLTQAWSNLTASNHQAFSTTNGQFFSTSSDPTPLAFPLKINNINVTDGYGNNEFVDQKKMLELWADHAKISNFVPQYLNTSSAPDIIIGLSEDADKSINTYTGRTFVGIDDRNMDGSYEVVLIFNSSYSRQSDAVSVLTGFGADNVMMLDGGGSTQLICEGTTFISSTREIPQTVGVTCASSPIVMNSGWCLPTGTDEYCGYLGWLEYNNEVYPWHIAIDMCNPQGESIYSIGDGEVLLSRTDVSGYGPEFTDGGAVVIRHQAGDGTWFNALYGHLDNPHQVGSVSKGEIIGYSNSFSPPHLHFGIHSGYELASNPWRGYSSDKNETYDFVDPIPFLNDHPVNTIPEGYLDAVDCNSFRGWAKDADTANPIRIDFYDGNADSGTFIENTMANIYRPDVGSNCGFNFSVPASLRDGNNHSIYAYAIDSEGGTNFLLIGSPKAINCVLDDNYEENDNLASAFDISQHKQKWLSEINGMGRQADEDWYKICVLPGLTKVIIDARFSDSEGDIDIQLYNSIGSSLAISQTTTDNEYISTHVLNSGSYYIKVFYGNGNTYDLYWNNMLPDIESIAIAGPTEINESSGAPYACTANFSDGSTQDVTSSVSWSENSSYATIDDNTGYLSTVDILSDQSFTITAVYNGKTDTHNVTIKGVPPVLTGITITGPSEVNESSGVLYACTASFSDGSTQDVTSSVSWSEDSAVASILNDGYLTISEVSGDSSCRITSEYELQIAFLDIVIMDTEISYPCDFNSDGMVNYLDLSLFADHWLITDDNPEWDETYNLNTEPAVSGKQIINYLDLSFLADYWLESY